MNDGAVVRILPGRTSEDMFLGACLGNAKQRSTPPSVARQVCTLGQGLAQQVTSILVGAVLPDPPDTAPQQCAPQGAIWKHL